MLTSACNLRCRYCYQNAKQPRRMSWETLREATNLLLATRQPRATLSFYGGEPFLCFGLIRRAVRHSERSRPSDLSVSYAVSTNGTLLESDQIAFLVRHRVQTQISFDGGPAAQALRGEATFPALDQLLTRLRRDHPGFFRDCVRVAMMVLPSTISQLGTSVRYFLKKGVQEIRVAPAVTDIECWSPERIGRLDEEFQEVFDVSLHHFEVTRKVPVALFRKALDLHWARPKRGPMCRVGRGTSLAVDVDGNVYACVIFANSFQNSQSDLMCSAQRALRLGPVTAHDLDRRLRGMQVATEGEAIFRQKEDKYSTYGRCSDCAHFFACSVCPAAISHTSGALDPHRVPDFVCAFNLVVNKFRERFPSQWFSGRRS
ncbi:MAG: radical SAM protein [bacterium]|nr:radical SAM protein [bacterium]